MKLQDIREKNIIIVGFGREGKNTYRTLKKLFPLKPIALADKNTIKADEKEIYTGKDYLKNLKKYDVVIKTPGIPFKEIEKNAGNAKITSQTELFLENCPGKVIGITGTKGKSTTSTLIYKILKDSFKNNLQEQLNYLQQRNIVFTSFYIFILLFLNVFLFISL